MLSVDRFLPRPFAGRSRRGGVFKKVFLFVMLTMVALITAVAIWGGYSYQNLISLQQHTQESYQKLDKSYSFTPPQSRSDVSLEPRWEAMLRSREKLLGRVSPEVKQSLNKILAMPAIKDWGALLKLLPATQAINQAIDEHVAALGQEQMSMKEYQWLLGLGMHTAMAAPEKHEPGARYWDVLRSMGRLSQGQDEANRVEPDRVYRMLGDLYQDQKPAPGEIIDKLRRPALADYAVDWLTVAAQWTGITPQTLGQTEQAGGKKE